MSYGGKHILSHGRCVATGGIAYSDALTVAIIEIDMVGANGGGAYKLHTAAGKQRLVAHGASADYECIGVGNAL